MNLSINHKICFKLLAYRYNSVISYIYMAHFLYIYISNIFQRLKFVDEMFGKKFNSSLMLFKVTLSKLKLFMRNIKEINSFLKLCTMLINYKTSMLLLFFHVRTKLCWTLSIKSCTFLRPCLNNASWHFHMNYLSHIICTKYLITGPRR